MNEIAIEVSRLSKLYRIGVRERREKTLYGAVARWIQAPWKNWRNLRSLYRFRDEDAPDVLWALREVSFRVETGEVMGIIGHNGSGKSTLLKIISRITEPSRGRVLIRGRVSSLLEVGTGFHPDLSGRENIFLNGAILGMSRSEIERKFDEIVDFSGVERFIDTPVRRYSSGMRLRLAFSVAAHLDPEILLIDEILAVGDAAFQQKCLGKMRGVAQEGRTVLFVSHDLGAVSSLTRRCLCLDGGRLVDLGETSEVVGRYLKKMLKTSQSHGFALLRELPRSGASGAKGRLEWVRTLGVDGRPTSHFFEGSTALVEVGVRLQRPCNGFRLALVVSSLVSGGRLFTVSSPPFAGPFSPGLYSVRVKMEPLHLRQGTYLMALGLTADGRREDRVNQALRLTVTAAAADQLYERWMEAPLQFSYPWQEPALVPDEEARQVAVG